MADSMLTSIGFGMALSNAASAGWMAARDNVALAILNGVMAIWISRDLWRRTQGARQ